MPKGKHRSKVDKAKYHYYQLYKTWKKVYCPALEADVLFTNHGLDHLAEEKWRTGVEKIERLKLLPLAKKLLEKSTTFQRKRFQNYHDHYEFTAWMDGVLVTAIVQESKKQYYFYSVFRA